MRSLEHEVVLHSIDLSIQVSLVISLPTNEQKVVSRLIISIIYGVLVTLAWHFQKKKMLFVKFQR